MEEIIKKEKFIERTKGGIILRNKMCDFIKENFVGVVERFNGKVYNKRFTDELNKNMPPQFNWWASRDDNTYDGYRVIHINVNIPHNGETIFCNAYLSVCVDENKRILLDETKEKLIQKLDEINAYTKQMQDTIDHYDEYKSFAATLDKMIRDYQREIPPHFRANVRGFAKYILN